MLLELAFLLLRLHLLLVLGDFLLGLDDIGLGRAGPAKLLYLLLAPEQILFHNAGSALTIRTHGAEQLLERGRNPL